MKAASLMKMLTVVIPMVIMLRYPYIKDFSIASADYQNGHVIITGTLRVQFTDEAWSEFGYKDGNFEWFEKWWQEEAPGADVGPFRLVSVTWTLIEHKATYDTLGFVAVFELRANANIDPNADFSQLP